MLVIMKYATIVFALAMKTLPRKAIRLPIPLVRVKEAAFLRAKTKALMADEQNDSPVRAT